MKSYRVIQWATGNIGSRSLQRVIEHPRLDLVGLWVSNPDKAGRDAGALCGLPDTGVKATNDAAALIALEADCVLYMRQGVDWDEVCAILASGKNIADPRRVPQSRRDGPGPARGAGAGLCAGWHFDLFDRFQPRLQHRGTGDPAPVDAAAAGLPDD